METAPRPVIPLEYAQPTTARCARWWWLAVRWGVVLCTLCLFVGWVLMFVDVETVVVTGPLLFLFGLVLAASAWRLKLMPAAMLGIAHCSICVLFFTLVNVRGWSPREAELPFQVMAGLYLVFVTAPASALLLMYMHAKGSSWFSTSRPITPAATLRGDANRP